MLQNIGRAAALAVALVAAAMAPLCAQDQKGTLVFAVESLGAQTLDPILEGRPGNAVYQAVMYDSLVGFDPVEGRRRSRRRRTLGARARRPRAGPSSSGPARHFTTATS